MTTDTQTIEDFTLPESKESKESKSEQIEAKPAELSILDIPGVGATTADKLSEGGYDSTISLAVATPGELTEAASMSETAARKIINFCRNNLNMGFETGESVLQRRETVKKISTGVASFDALMGGGFETGSITECFGEFGSSKTQIAHVLCVQTLKTYPNSIAVYIDTEKTFRPERIIQFAEGLGLDPKDALARIKVAKAYNSDHQMLLAEKVEELINKEGLDIKLVIVDSLTAHFRAEFVGRGTLAVRQQKPKQIHA